MKDQTIVIWWICFVVWITIWSWMMLLVSKQPKTCTPSQEHQEVMKSNLEIQRKLNRIYIETMNRFDEIYQCKEFLKDNK